MKDKHFLLSINNDKPLGSDNLNGKLLRIIANDIATSVYHIFNLSLLEIVCPQAWREAKVIHLPSKAPFTGSNSLPISLLPTLSKLLFTVWPDTIWQQTFSMLKGKDIQQAHTQMTIDWLREMYDIKIVVPVDIIDHSLLLEK